MKITIDPKQLNLTQLGQDMMGSLDMFYLQKDAAHAVVAAEQQRIDMALKPKQYEYLSKSGMILERHLTINRNSAEIHVVIRDSGSGLIGSVSIPLKNLEAPTN